MYKSIVYFSTFFFALLMVFGIFLGYFGAISFNSAFLSIILAAIIALLFLRHQKVAPAKLPSFEKLDLCAVLILVLFTFSMLIIIFPELIFPFTCSDLENHSRSIRIMSKTGFFNEDLIGQNQLGLPLVYTHSYPNGYYSVGVQFYSIFGNAYGVNTIFALIILVLIGLLVFALTQRFFDKKSAVVALFISLFSITTLLILEHGFLPQLFGSFFLLSAFYAFTEKKRLLWFFSIIGLFAYPPFFGILFVFMLLALIFGKEFNFNLLLNIFRNKKSFDIKGAFGSIKKNLLVLIPWLLLIILAFFIILPESLGILLQYFNIDFAKDNVFLIRGGIITPNIFGLLPFVLVLYPIYLILTKIKRSQKNKFDKHRGNKGNSFQGEIKNFHTNPFYALIISGLLMSALIVFFYALNLFISFSYKKELTALYQAVKFFYFTLIPLSIVAGVAFVRLYNLNLKNLKLKRLLKAGLILLLLFELIYFFGYLQILMEKDNQPFGYYAMMEKIDKLPPGTAIGVDGCITMGNGYKNPFFYQSLIDNPDPIGPSICRQTELTRALQFWWADYKYKDGRFRIYDSNGREVLLIGNEANFGTESDPASASIDYYLAYCTTLDKEIIAAEGNFRLYKMK